MIRVTSLHRRAMSRNVRRLVLLSLSAVLVSACGVSSEGPTGIAEDSALAVFLNQLVDSGDDPPPDSVDADLFAGLRQLFRDRGYDTDPDDTNDDAAAIPLATSPQSVTLEAFAAATSNLLAQGTADLTGGDPFLLLALGDVTVGDPAAAGAPLIRAYRVEPDERVLVNERVRFRVIHALAGSPNPATLTVPGATVEGFALGDATDYFLQALGGSLEVSLNAVTVSCPVVPGRNIEAIIAHADFDIADEASREPALFCHPVAGARTPTLGD